MNNIDFLKDRLETLFCASPNLSNEYSQIWDEVNYFVAKVKETIEAQENNLKVFQERNNIITKRAESLVEFLKDIGYSDKEINNIIKLRGE